MTELTLVEASEAHTYVAVKGRLDAAGVGAVGLKLSSQIVTRRKPGIIDLSAVEMIESLGIGMLVEIGHAMRRHHLALVIVATGLVKEILDKLAMSSFFPVVATREDAVRALPAS